MFDSQSHFLNISKIVVGFEKVKIKTKKKMVLPIYTLLATSSPIYQIKLCFVGQ